MYHIELRQFPHNFNHFNLDERELRALLDPWVRGYTIEVGERKWSPHQAKLKVLEGRHLPIEELSMGRGWRTAERESEDVTERVLAAARAALAASPAPPAVTTPPAGGAPGPTVTVQGSAGAASSQPAPDTDPLALGVQPATLLGSQPELLLAAWREIAARAPGLSPSESLALAERQIEASQAGSG